MKELIKKHRVAIVLGIILALALLNVYLYKGSQKLTEIRIDLEVANYRLNLDIRKSRVKETRYLQEIKEKNLVIERLNTGILNTLKENRDLKKKLVDLLRPGAAKEEKTKSLLARRLDLTLKTTAGTEEELQFYRRKTMKQEEVITHQELVYLECRDRLKLKDRQIEQVQAAMGLLDRHYKRKFLKKLTIKYTIGIIAGIIAGYFMFKTRG
jgi:hypothetical protein